MEHHPVRDGRLLISASIIEILGKFKYGLFSGTRAEIRMTRLTFLHFSIKIYFRGQKPEILSKGK